MTPAAARPDPDARPTGEHCQDATAAVCAPDRPDGSTSDPLMADGSNSSMSAAADRLSRQALSPARRSAPQAQRSPAPGQKPVAQALPETDATND